MAEGSGARLCAWRSPGLALTLACLAAVPALAQPTNDEEELALAYGDKASVSLATGSRQSLRRAPAVATVITAQDIAAMGAVDLEQVLESVPGMHVGRNNQGYNPLFLIRGIHSEFNPQTLVLQNGVPLTTMFVGNRGLGAVGTPLDNVARIEVIRGPGSALHGADAYAGVINIITKNAADIAGTEVGLRAGSFDTRDAWVLHGGTRGPLEIAAYFRVGRTAGFKRTVTADAQTQLDSLFGTRASLAPGPLNVGHDAVDGGLELAQGKLRFRATYTLRQNVGSGAGVGAALDPVGQQRAQRIVADVAASDIELARDWRTTFAASLFHYTQDFNRTLQVFPPGAFGNSFPNGMFGAPRTWERQLRLSAITTYTGLASHQLRFGVGHDDLNLYRTQEFKNFSFITSGPLAGLPTPTPNGEVIEFPVADSFLMPHRRRVTYAYAQDEWGFARDWTLTAGVRRDHFSDFGATTNPRLALVWDASLDITAKLLAGRAFRAPTLNEQHSINNPVVRGNPALRPETISTLEAAFSWQARPDTQLGLSVFRYVMHDMIRAPGTGSGSGSAATFNNVGGQRGRGFELEATSDITRNLRLAAHYAYQRALDDTSGQDAGYAPHHHLFARADWSFAGQWLASAQANHVAGRKRPAGDARAPIADYTTLDLSLRTQRAKSGWSFAAAVRNLFNADVREPSAAPGLALPNDLPMAPRSFYLEASYRL